ncbi:Lrp/AsnC family transcriptional regulator [Pseudoalteromonas denitrificans]|uniref:siroheme decarboxylase n=1 Tax=Pseudoalteromonas denitrificans DSM 6059 TaxID=1123010 RepID=A0A1I1MRZ0_9GAMM|nr:Lrp/AsnC family transcriptional regulator [Pseudoalteromonas denitrificans]SFC88197.1 transcriptional regulator, AsnC family [Pseudoalteromonas denitrificans DSM 6059]
MTTDTQQLNELERAYIVLTQKGLPICSQPYHWLAEQLKITVDQTLDITSDLISRGIIRRIAAVPNHYKLGYILNGMTTWDIKDDKAIEYGKKIGELPFVSHCYLRPRHLPNWHYNLFAMIHGRNTQEVQHYQDQIKELLKDVLQTHQGKSQDVLTSTRILKKTGLRLKVRN